MGELETGRRRTYRRFGVLAATVAAFAVVFVAASGAVLGGGTAFEGSDGNLTVDTSGNRDWSSFSPTALVDVASGTSDNAFGQGSKEDDPDVTIVTGSIPPNKNDLTRSYLTSETTNGNVYLYLAWERALNTGSANIDFELNQNPTAGWSSSTTGDVTINRTAGDLLITYDFGGSGTPTIGLLKWVTSGSTSQCYASNSLPCWGNHIDMTGLGFAEAAVNTGSVSEPFLGGSLAAGLFGEAALNLSSSELHVFEPHTCRSFGSMFVKSRSSGSSIDAELKDFIAPAPIHVGNCGSIELRKTWAGTKGNVTLAIGTSAGGSQTDSQAVSGADGTTGANTVEDGTYYVSESLANAGDYTSSLACTRNGSGISAGSDGSVSVAAGQTVVCTFTNTRKQGSIELRKTWNGSKGDVTLAIGTSAGGSQVDSQALSGSDGTTGANTVDTGTYYVSESLANAGDYTSSLACTDNGASITPGAGGSLAVAEGHDVVCTFTNTHKQGSIELRKAWVGTKGDVTLAIGTSAGGSQVDTQALSGADGTTGANTVDTGTYYVSESLANPGDYTSSLACTDDGSAVTPGTGGSVAVADGHHVVCTFTNTRDRGSIELRKAWVGAKGNVTLAIGTTAGGSQVDSQALTGSDGTTGANAVDTGTYYVSESVANAGDYDSALSCTDNGGAASAGSDGAIAVASGHAVVCTFTNTRRPGSIELAKTWVGTKGDVTLAIGTSAGGSQVDTQALSGSDGTTGANAVAPGTYYVSESLANAGDYTSSLACTDNGSAVTPGTGGSVAVASNHTVVCTFTNTRKRGSIELRKTWVGIKSDVTLAIGTAAGGSQVDSQALTGADGTTGSNDVDTGTYYVSESVADAADYTSSLACTDNGASAAPGSDGSIAVANGHAVVCTFTNSRKPGSIELRKTWLGTKGDVTLAIGTSAGGSQVDSQALAGADGTTGANAVAPGTYYVSESTANAADYDSALACTDNGNAVTPGDGGSLDVASNHTVVCTFTNTRKQGSVELAKTWVGDKGNATLKIGTSAGGSQAASKALTGADGTTGTVTVDSGTYFVSESFDAPTDAADYDASLACTDNGSAVTPGAGGSVAVADGHHVVCTFTNRQLPQVRLVKSLQPSDDDGTFDFSIDDRSFTNGGDGYGDGDGTGFVRIQPGSPAIAEHGHGDTDLADYDSSISCDTEESAGGTSLTLDALDYGDKVTCTFTNVRRATLEIVKHALGGSAAFDFTLTKDGAEGSTSFQLSPAAGGTSSDTRSLSPGDYHVVEAAQAGWSLTGLSCSTGGSADQANPARANVHLEAGDTVQCTYTNTKLATLVVKKIVDNSNGGGSLGPGAFTIHVTSGGLEIGKAAGSSTGTSYSLLPGTYGVHEDSVSGYTLTSTTGDCLSSGFVTLLAGQTATCTLTNTSAAPPPPPPSAPPAPPAPRIDLQITKSGAPSPASLGGEVTWSMVVTNNGPNGATGVTVADPVPAGTTFVSVASTQGTCAGSVVVSCQLGSLAAGASVTITLVTRAATTGTVTNTGTVVGNEQETSTANNTASANVQVRGAFVPPVRYCTAVAVSPKSLTVGHKTLLTMRVHQNGKAVKGVRIRIRGASLAIRTSPSNARGVVKRAVQPKRAGIVTFVPVAQKSCRNVRVGVIGVFTPPVTG